jgi:hypothetical protein
VHDKERNGAEEVGHFSMRLPHGKADVKGGEGFWGGARLGYSISVSDFLSWSRTKA